MERDQSVHRRHNTIPQSIPLQDLSRPPEDYDSLSSDAGQHRRTLSDRGRRLLERGASIRQSTRYSRLKGVEGVVDTGPVNTAKSYLSSPELEEDDGEERESTMADRGRFQEAMGFAGLSFQPDHSSAADFSAGSIHDGRGDLQNVLGYNDSQYSLEDVSVPGAREDSDSTFTETDMTPLTDLRHAQHKSALVPSTPPGQRHDRLSAQSVRFVTPGRSPPRARLGDDLAAAESGTLTPERVHGSPVIRSLSPSSAESPLHRASTIVRKMSQRVVNLSNEPEIIEQEMKHRASQRHQENQRPSQSFDYSRDGAQSPLEKTPSPEVRPIQPNPKDWVRFANPLRGKSLGIFPPDSPIRTTLCDFMVHPFIEPFILFLIIVQTVLLAVQAAPNWYENPQSNKWNDTWIDYLLLCLYVIYTVEIGIRIVVSGFIVNPIEYSTINRQVGLRDALSAKAHSLFALQRGPSTKNAKLDATAHQPSILRTLTSTPGYAAFAADAKHAQRIRLAHRAFLRHSFNRLDFLAVVSYWISFALSVTGIGTIQHIHAFGMLSTLRILRLLSLTSGTSVSPSFSMNVSEVLY